METIGLIVAALCLLIPLALTVTILILKARRDSREFTMVSRQKEYYHLIAEKKPVEMLELAVKNRKTRSTLVTMLNRSGYHMFDPLPINIPPATKVQNLLEAHAPVDRAVGVCFMNLFEDPYGLTAAKNALVDPDVDVRLTSVRVLNLIATPGSAAELVWALANNVLPWERVVERLDGTWALPELLNSLQTYDPQELPNKHFRANVARALGLIGDPSAQPALVNLLGSALEEDRINAVRAIGQCRLQNLVPLIQNILKEDDSSNVRAQSATALGALPDVSSVPVLTSAMFDPSWWVCSNSARSLGKLGSAGLTALKDVSLNTLSPRAAHRASEQLSLLKAGR